MELMSVVRKFFGFKVFAPKKISVTLNHVDKKNGIVSKLEDYRLKHGLSKCTMSKRIGVSSSLYVLWCKSINKPNAFFQERSTKKIKRFFKKNNIN